MKLLALGLPSSPVCWAGSQAAHPSGCQSGCQSSSIACLLQKCVSSPHLIQPWLQPCLAEVWNTEQVWAVQTYRWTPGKLLLLLLLTAKPNLACGTNTFHSETARPRGAQGSIKCFFLPCSEHLLACSGGASGIIVGLVLSHWSRAIVLQDRPRKILHLLRGEQMNWQRRGSGCWFEGNSTAFVTYRIRCPSAEVPCSRVPEKWPTNNR